MGTRKVALALLATLVAAVSVSACGGGGSSSGGGSGSSAPGVSSEKIELGGTNTSSGADASACLPNVEGSEAWIKKVNEEGGVDGREIVWNLLDNKGNPAQAVSNARQLVTKENVLAMFGGCGSAPAAAIMPFLEQEKVPYLFPNALSPGLLNQEMAFQFTPLFNQQLSSVLTQAYKEKGPGNVAIVYIEGLDNPMVEAVQKVAEESGKKLVTSIPVSFEETDFGPVAIKVKNADPEYIALGTSTPQAGELVKALAAQGFKPKDYIGTQALADSVYGETAGGAANGVSLAGSPIIPSTAPEAKECNESLPSSLEPTFYTLLGCAQAQLMVEALKKAGKEPTRESLVKALQSFKNVETGTTPPITWKPNGMMIETLSIQSLLPNGEFEQVAQSPLPEPLVEE
ncbi:MAG TPA: ABC transporter substrate-binding protein [Solirubrobacterales bacterium]|jgi:branched-chain amino acid transport system substrate-binding protein|nr:ABC transporter substrate-binding protein [Solirubrobacterales bacterium]